MKIFNNPAAVQAAGKPSKKISEYIGYVNSKTDEVSIAKMISPGGWSEPGQTPEFNEYTIVLSGILVVETSTEKIEVRENGAVLIEKGEWVKYSTPYEYGAEYISVCIPAFSLDRVHRDE